MNATQLREPMLRLCLFPLLVLWGGCTSAGEPSNSSDDVAESALSREKDKKSEQETKRDDEIETSLVIPLEDIWAWNISGTKSLMTLTSVDPSKKNKYWTYIEDVNQTLGPVDQNNQSSRGVVVKGTGLDALRNVHAIRTKHQASEETIKAGSDISILFFMHAMSPNLQLKRVTVENYTIEIVYELVPRIDAGKTTHFALIPIQAVKEGQYQVKFTRSTSTETFDDVGISQLPIEVSELAVSKPFHFKVIQD